MQSPHTASLPSADSASRGQEIKSILQGEQEKTMEAICEIIYSNSLFFEDKAASNKNLLSALRHSHCFSDIGIPMVDAMEVIFTNSGAVLEEAIISLIREYSDKIKEIAEFNIRLIDTLDEENSDYARNEKMYSIIISNFKSSMDMIVYNAGTVIKCCTSYIGLHYHLNEKLASGLSAQVKLAREKKEEPGIDLNAWLSEWWKQNEKDEAA